MTHLTVDLQGPVARLVLSRPPANTLDIRGRRDLTAAARQLAAEPLGRRPRLLVLASALDHQFSQGVDPRAVLAADLEGRRQIFLALGDMVEALWFCHIPILADISGPAIAGGAVLAALADFAVIDASAGKVCFSEPKVGLPLPFFVQRLIQRKVNPAAVTEVLLLGRNVDAQEACKIGFANAAYSSPDQRTEAIQQVAGRVIRLPPLALSETLRHNRAPERAALTAFKQDLGAFADFLTDEYLGKGLKAVLAGESPVF